MISSILFGSVDSPSGSDIVHTHDDSLHLTFVNEGRVDPVRWGVSEGMPLHLECLVDTATEHARTGYTYRTPCCTHDMSTKCVTERSIGSRGYYQFMHVRPAVSTRERRNMPRDQDRQHAFRPSGLSGTGHFWSGRAKSDLMSGPTYFSCRPKPVPQSLACEPAHARPVRCRL